MPQFIFEQYNAVFSLKKEGNSDMCYNVAKP